LLFDQLIAFPFVFGGLMFYGLLHRARLVPRWISTWGLAGAVVYLLAPVAAMFDVAVGFLMAPLAIQEMVLAVWLIAKGFNEPQAARTSTVSSHQIPPTLAESALPARLP
jgi:hypothetical protein